MSLLHKYFHKFSLMINVLALDSQTFCKRKSVFTPARSSVHTETVATVWWLVVGFERRAVIVPSLGFVLLFTVTGKKTKQKKTENKDNVFDYIIIIIMMMISS